MAARSRTHGVVKDASGSGRVPPSPFGHPIKSRPQPPRVLTEPTPESFAPDRNLASWVRHTFLSQLGALYNKDHEHLAFARIGYAWTNVPNRHHERWVVGTAEMPQTQGSAWKRGRASFQLREWFEDEPDFLITLYAPVLATVDDREFCRVIEHELYHCGHATTRDGVPRFHRDGTPIFGIRGHDVEEFIGVVQRYGVAGTTREFVDAASKAPQVDDDTVASACGTCGARV